MLSTSLAAVVLSGLAAATSAALPVWQTDYGIAVAMAKESQKPIAVFIGRGGSGYARITSDGGLTVDENLLLQKSYVCLYVNTETANGKQLAEAFEMQEGLVISGRSGAKQALRHEGKIEHSELKKYLIRYAVQNQAVITTETPNAAKQTNSPTIVAPFQPQPAALSYIPSFSGSLGAFNGIGLSGAAGCRT
jgi:hypothetical protein